MLAMPEWFKIFVRLTKSPFEGKIMKAKIFAWNFTSFSVEFEIFQFLLLQIISEIEKKNESINWTWSRNNGICSRFLNVNLNELNELSWMAVLLSCVTTQMPGKIKWLFRYLCGNFGLICIQLAPVFSHRTIELNNIFNICMNVKKCVKSCKRLQFHFNNSQISCYLRNRLIRMVCVCVYFDAAGSNKTKYLRISLYFTGIFRIS